MENRSSGRLGDGGRTLRLVGSERAAWESEERIKA
jgi:hypothetical protein